MTLDWLDARPVIVAIAGPNGAGKSTFHEAFLASSGLRFVNADEIARRTGIDAYEAAAVAETVRVQLVTARESFVFETVFSDPVSSKVSFLEEVATSGYTVVLCFVGISSAEQSDQRVAMRVSQGGHDVAPEKLLTRYPRTLANLAEAIRRLPHVIVYDNDDLAAPYRRVAEFQGGRAAFLARRLPSWLRPLLP